MNWRTQIFYFSESSNTTVWKYSITSKSPEFKVLQGESTEVLSAKCTTVLKVKVLIMQNGSFQSIILFYH